VSVILIKSGAKARRLEPQPLEAEKVLQKYIIENPECLPMDEIEEELRVVLVAREFPAGNGSIDALGLDSEGGVYIIETKLYRNADKRRVLAQMLDYGAGLWHGYRGSGEFIAKLEERGRRILERGIRAEIEAAFELDGEETGQLLEHAAENVAAGRIGFVVLMDYIDDDLKTLIAFVNANSEFAIYGVELEFYELDADTKLAIPRLYGAETPRKGAGKALETVRDEAFFEQASSLVTPEVVAAMRALYDFSVREADAVKWGRGAKGSFNPKFYSISPKSIYTLNSDGRLSMNFGWLGGTDPGRMVVEMLGQELKRMGFAVPDDFPKRYVRIDASWWVPRLDALKKTIQSACLSAKMMSQ
jgi:hypothetical protein